MSDRILLGHGSGGSLMHSLIADHLAPVLMTGPVMDAAILDLPSGGKLAMSTDSYVVSPIFFPGSDIGEMAINGTVNDLSMAGAKPLYITAGFIIEEGLLISDLKRIADSMANAAKAAGVRIVAGDTKVVDKGKADAIFINTSGIGVIPDGVDLKPANIRPGDSILISGPIASHGIAVMAKRNGLSFDPPLQSDTAALNGLVSIMIEACRDAGDISGLRVLRDPTRGGMATTLKEFAIDCGLCMTVIEQDVPVLPPVRGACELLGLDPIYVANEGVLLAVASPHVSKYLLDAMRRHPLAVMAAEIGVVEAAPSKGVVVKTSIGGSRMVDMLYGGQLPRIC